MAVAPSKHPLAVLSDPEQAHAYARATARLLASGRVLAAFSGGIAIVAALALAVMLALAADGGKGAPARTWGLWAVLASAVPAAWYAWRVRLDEGLFADLARSIATRPSSNAALADLDAALAALGLAAVNDNALRSLQSRGIGARRLVILQGAIASGQAVVLLVLLFPGLT